METLGHVIGYWLELLFLAPVGGDLAELHGMPTWLPDGAALAASGLMVAGVTMEVQTTFPRRSLVVIAICVGALSVQGMAQDGWMMPIVTAGYTVLLIVARGVTGAGLGRAIHKHPWPWIAAVAILTLAASLALAFAAANPLVWSQVRLAHAGIAAILSAVALLRLAQVQQNPALASPLTIAGLFIMFVSSSLQISESPIESGIHALALPMGVAFGVVRARQTDGLGA